MGPFNLPWFACGLVVGCGGLGAWWWWINHKAKARGALMAVEQAAAQIAKEI